MLHTRSRSTGRESSIGSNEIRDVRESSARLRARVLNAAVALERRHGRRDEARVARARALVL